MSGGKYQFSCDVAFRWCGNYKPLNVIGTVGVPAVVPLKIRLHIDRNLNQSKKQFSFGQRNYQYSIQGKKGKSMPSMRSHINK